MNTSVQKYKKDRINDKPLEISTPACISHILVNIMNKMVLIDNNTLDKFVDYCITYPGCNIGDAYKTATGKTYYNLSASEQLPWQIVFDLATRIGTWTKKLN